MTKIIVLMLTISVLICANAQAVVIEISLPELHGVYPIDQANAERTAVFELPQIPAVIHGAWIRLSGTAEVGSVTCEWGGPYPWTMEFSPSMQDTGSGHYWRAFELMPESAGPFVWIAEFDPSPPTGTTWTFLLDGEGEVSLFGAPTGLVGLCSPVTPSPTAEVTEAVLIIDAEFPIPVKPQTWGKIKALYEDSEHN